MGRRIIHGAVVVYPMCELMVNGYGAQRAVLETALLLGKEGNLSHLEVTGMNRDCVEQSYDTNSEIRVEDITPVPNSSAVVKTEVDERNFLRQLVTSVKEEHVNQSPDVISETNFEKDLVPISFPMVKREPEERNISDQHVPGIKDHNQDLTSQIKLEKDSVPVSFPVVKRELEEQNFLDQLVTVIKEENVNQSSDVKSEINSVPIAFPVVKREPEEEQSDLDTVNEESSLEVMAEDNEDLAESIVDNVEKSVSQEVVNIVREEDKSIQPGNNRKDSPNVGDVSRNSFKLPEGGVSRGAVRRLAVISADRGENAADVSLFCAFRLNDLGSHGGLWRRVLMCPPLMTAHRPGGEKFNSGAHAALTNPDFSGCINRNSGLQLSAAWAPAIKFLTAQTTGRHQWRTHENSSAEPTVRPKVIQPESTKQDDTSAAFSPQSALITANRRTAPRLTPPTGTIN
ncbi:hypothetical protein ANN_27836 [Periplaneta americana]|uniref:Uncharacterized protein n=1 Tax=Periplaneta americana TaxID=6978 RepID=A0ABQ8RVQ5_PERAM|nr:hypothetical protein ANN_27836 [Periplaneta americana]